MPLGTCQLAVSHNKQGSGGMFYFVIFIQTTINTGVGIGAILLAGECLQPSIYIAKSAISSRTARTSFKGARNTVAITAGIALCLQPSIYIMENAISSGTAGTSSKGAKNTVVVMAGIALISIAAASSILLQVGKNSPPVQNIEYSGPSLSYYINKFQPPQIMEASMETHWKILHLYSLNPTTKK